MGAGTLSEADNVLFYDLQTGKQFSYLAPPVCPLYPAIIQGGLEINTGVNWNLEFHKPKLPTASLMRLNSEPEGPRVRLYLYPLCRKRARSRIVENGEKFAEWRNGEAVEKQLELQTNHRHPY